MPYYIMVSRLLPGMVTADYGKVLAVKFIDVHDYHVPDCKITATSRTVYYSADDWIVVSSLGAHQVDASYLRRTGFLEDVPWETVKASL